MILIFVICNIRNIRNLYLKFSGIESLMI